MGRTLGILESSLGAAELGAPPQKKADIQLAYGGPASSVGGVWDLAHLGGTVNSYLTLNSNTTGLIYSSNVSGLKETY